MAHITLLTAGSRGDTQPYLALGVGLKHAGHYVTLAASEGFEDFVTAQGIAYAPVTGDFRTILAQTDDWSGKAKRNSFLATARSLAMMVGPIMEAMGRDCLAASQGADLIICAFPFLGYDIAQALGVKFIQASLFPFAATGEFSQPFVAASVPRPLNRLTFTLAQGAAWAMFSGPVNRFRRTLGLKPYPINGPYREWDAARIPTLYGFSPTLIPRPADWPDIIHIAGYWYTLTGESWQPPADLAAFLEAGPPPVFIGFGSMPDPDPARTTGPLLDALAQSGQRGLLLSGWGGLGQIDLPESVFRIENAPYDWLFPHMAAVIHHGGAGTTHLALRSGAPSMIVPFGGDQFFWGHRIAALGVGPAPLARGRLTAPRLAEAIRVLTSSEAMRARAAKVGAAMRQEDGIGCAVGIVEEVLGRS